MSRTRLHTILAASMQAHGVHTAIYSDRHLLTPLNLRLLSEVLRQVPKGKTESLKISTARASRSNSAGWAVFRNFVEDGMRRAVMQELCPNAEIEICEKAQLPHERSLNLRLGDCRNITILLD